MVRSMREELDDDLHSLIFSAFVRVVQKVSKGLQVVNPIGQMKNDFLHLLFRVGPAVLKNPADYLRGEFSLRVRTIAFLLKGDV